MNKAEDILTQWLQAAQQRELDKLLALYDERAVLIPTFSNKLLNTPAKIRDYFEKLCGRDNLHVTLHRQTLLDQPINDQLHALNGIYNWSFAVEDEPLNFEARFSFVFDFGRNRPIVHHHSSQIPRML